MASERERRIHFISLGCPKNRVDSEVMLGVAQKRRYRHVDDPADAQVIVVNTCGFIDPAKKESIDTILEMANYKEAGSCERLVVAGCLSQRHPEELSEGLPEVDHFLGSSDMLRLGDVLDGGGERMMVGSPADWLVAADSPRALSSSPASAYLKIAEGCNRRCSFCVIPALRGKQRSRTIADVVSEAQQLAAQGVKEINLISQDTVNYGRDLGERPPLAELVEQVAEVPGVHWVRVFYLYPDALDDRLVELLADHPRVVPYIDMPLQHAADGMLRRMRRGHGGKRLRTLVERLRARIDGLTFRTAFIVGHPGESQGEFDELCEFVEWARFERVGVFRYSDEEDSHSRTLDDKVAPLVAANRWRRLMAIARRVANAHNSQLVGRELDVLVEGQSDEHDLVLMGRHAGQAPEIDGQVYLSGTEQLGAPPRPGQLVEVRISQASDYDLVGEVQRVHGPDRSASGAAEPRKRVALRVLGSTNRGSTKRGPDNRTVG
jgi:ribosomal protein S12 methylthiotransferase